MHRTSAAVLGRAHDGGRGPLISAVFHRTSERRGIRREAGGSTGYGLPFAQIARGKDPERYDTAHQRHFHQRGQV